MSSKEKVLELLENNKTEYISGEAIASQLGLSRNAIWKAINELRKAGYNIEAVSNKGYHLAANNDIISPQGIISYIEENSTNDSALIDKIRIYAVADNVALWSARKGLDPRQGYASANSTYYSPMRAISGGLNITF